MNSLAASHCSAADSSVSRPWNARWPRAKAREFHACPPPENAAHNANQLVDGLSGLAAIDELLLQGPQLQWPELVCRRSTVRLP